MTIGKDTFSLTKGEFSKKLSRIVDAHRAGAKLIGEPRNFIITAARLADRFSTVANEPDVELRVKLWPCGPRKVKMAVMKRKDGKEYPIPKNQLVDALYPPKQTVRTPNLERKHVTAVRAAMRQLVDHQLRAYRKTLEYPIECYVTGKQLRPGMRVDIDHLGKPFVQLADEWIEGLGMTYCDFVLVGPPNLKRFKEAKYNDAWSLYHKDHARLIPACAAANRSKGASGYETPVKIIGSLEKTCDEEIDLDF